MGMHHATSVEDPSIHQLDTLTSFGKLFDSQLKTNAFMVWAEVHRLLGLAINKVPIR